MIILRYFKKRVNLGVHFFVYLWVYYFVYF
jgi:hypothetical protein